MGIRRSVLYIVPGGEKSHHLIQFGSVLFFFISFICSYDGASKSISWQIIPKAKTNLIVGNKFWQRNPKRLTKNYNIQHAEIKFISFLAFFTEINQTVTRLQRLTILKMEWFHFCGVQHKLLLNHIDICVCFVFCNEKSLAYNLQHTKVNEDDLHEKKTVQLSCLPEVFHTHSTAHWSPLCCLKSLGPRRQLLRNFHQCELQNSSPKTRHLFPPRVYRALLSKRMQGSNNYLWYRSRL